MSEDWPATVLDVKLAHERLQARRLELLARYAHVRELADEELDSREIEQEENAAELWDARVLSAMGDADRRAAARVVDALRRLDAGSYGTCVGCGDDIDHDRLAVLPEAERCVECAEQVRD
jgi:RNA polymerase-binding transcription factor DksA